MEVFNREMLTLAREARGSTQTALAKALNISQAEISKYENGIREPSEEMVRRFAKRLEFTSDFFYLNEYARSFGSGCVYHRKRQSAAEMKLQQLLAMINIKRIQVKRLLRAVNTRNASGFVRMDIDEYSGGAKEIANKARALWHLPPGPIQNLVRAVEDAGGVVVRCDFGTDKVDALSQFLPGAPPIFMINESIPADRMRFTLAHEIGHILMHQLPTNNMERQADEFAAEFLMPEANIKPHLAYVDLPKLASLKPFWRVSMNALLYRASEIGAIDQRRKSYLWMLMGQQGFRKNEPVQIAPEFPTAIRELLQLYRAQLGYQTHQLEKLTCEPNGLHVETEASSGVKLQLVK